VQRIAPTRASKQVWLVFCTALSPGLASDGPTTPRTRQADIVSLIGEQQEYELWVDNVRYSNLPSFNEYVVEAEKK
jgi:hypothetical protein